MSVEPPPATGVYRAGKGRGRGGLDPEAAERLRARKEEEARRGGGFSLPGKDGSRQTDALLGNGAAKVARCGKCTRPLDAEAAREERLLCSRCVGGGLGNSDQHEGRGYGGGQGARMERGDGWDREKGQRRQGAGRDDGGWWAARGRGGAERKTRDTWSGQSGWSETRWERGASGASAAWSWNAPSWRTS
mmetsp:Transcript_11586/g.30997  ORF Transcript_11586/g.30997 Transcript_11586/m.30997 type:complete len:190 (-) Transcript_11586:30-599(-)